MIVLFTGMDNLGVELRLLFLVTKPFPTLATPWTVACQAPLFMILPRQEYWSGLPFLPPGHLPHSGMEPMSPVAPALADGKR